MSKNFCQDGHGNLWVVEMTNVLKKSIISICIAGLKIMFGQWKMSSPSGDFSVVSHVDRSHTLSLLNLQPNPVL